MKDVSHDTRSIMTKSDLQSLKCLFPQDSGDLSLEPSYDAFSVYDGLNEQSIAHLRPGSDEHL